MMSGNFLKAIIAFGRGLPKDLASSRDIRITLSQPMTVSHSCPHRSCGPSNMEIRGHTHPFPFSRQEIRNQKNHKKRNQKKKGNYVCIMINFLSIFNNRELLWNFDEKQFSLPLRLYTIFLIRLTTISGINISEMCKKLFFLFPFK